MLIFHESQSPSSNSSFLVFSSSGSATTGPGKQFLSLGPTELLLTLPCLDLVEQRSVPPIVAGLEYPWGALVRGLLWVSLCPFQEDRELSEKGLGDG